MSDLIARLRDPWSSATIKTCGFMMEEAANRIEGLMGAAGWLAAIVIDKHGGTDDLPAWVHQSAKHYADALARAESAERELAELRAQQPDRIELRNNPDGTLDEVVGRGSFHLEQMDTGHWWLGFGRGGPLLHVNLRSRNKITATTLDDRTPAEKAENQPAQQPKAE